MDMLKDLLEIPNIVAVLVAIAAFATVLTLAAPIVQGDKMKSRMKTLATERNALRAQRRNNLQTPSIGRLREKPKGTFSQIVDTLNLRKFLEAEKSKQQLRAAGYRSETHLVTFLALRVISPLVLGVIAFIYSTTVFADQLAPNMRVVACGLVAIVGFYVPSAFLKNIMTRRQLSIKRAWSDAMDLMLICVESGMSIEHAIKRVAGEIGAQSVPLAEELTLTNAELSYLPERRTAYDNFGKRTGLQTIKSVMTSLIQSERYGTPLGQALRVLAQENRDARMQEAERKAAALPPKLTVPMVLFFLPVIFVVILGPAGIMAFG